MVCNERMLYCLTLVKTLRGFSGLSATSYGTVSHVVRYIVIDIIVYLTVTFLTYLQISPKDRLR